MNIDNLMATVSIAALVKPLLAFIPLITGIGGIGGASTDFKVQRSLRFRSNNSNYLTRTLGSAGNRTTWTWSGWVKRSALSSSGVYMLFSNYIGGTTYTFCYFTSDYFDFGDISGGTPVGRKLSNRLFRDSSAWIHVVVVWDTNNATASNRIRIYFNGVRETSMSSSTDPSSGANSQVNTSGYPFTLGYFFSGNPLCNDGYMAEVNFVDGQALDPSYFGETDPFTGSWIPKQYTGTYGTNGFRLDFSDNSAADSTHLGADRSGNGNNFTVNNFSVTDGVTNDSLTDSPSNYGSDTGVGGEVRGNFCTWSANWPSLTVPSEGLLKSPTAGVAIGNQSLLQYDAYWELTSTGGTSTAGVWQNSSTYTTTIASGKTYGFRLTTAGTLEYKNITDSGSWTSITTGLTESNNPVYIYTSGAASTYAHLNCGQRPFAATAPSGYKCVCTQSLTDPAVKKPSQYFDGNLRSGTGSSGSVTGKNLTPDIVWSKSRSSRSHMIADSVRGTAKYSSSNSAGAEVSDAQSVTAFNSDGFSFGTSAILNTNGESFIDWLWKKSATAGIDIITYSGNSTNSRQIAHNLGVRPAMYITKTRESSVFNDWNMWLAATGNDQLWMMSTSAKNPGGFINSSSLVDSTYFTPAQTSYDNLTGNTYVAYLFTEVKGFSKFGTYTGNGAADGPVIWCGFKPRWILVKRTDSSGDWYIWDSLRDTYNPSGLQLLVDSNAAEASSSPDIDILSIGFKIRDTTAAFNANTGTFIFAAFAEEPYKYARAR